MEQLFTPQLGLMVWTIVAFVVLVGVLSKFGWKPLLEALDAREESIRNNLRSAEASKAEAARLKSEVEQQLARVESRTKEMLATADAEARRLREEGARAAQVENERLMDITRKKLAEEERRLLRDVRAQVAEISLQAAEKILRQGLDKTTRDRLLIETVKDLGGTSLS